MKKNNITLPFNSEEFEEIWACWVQHRIEKKQKLTPTTIDFQIKKLKRWGEKDSIASITRSIENGWVGLFEPEHKNPKSKDGKDWGSTY